MTLSGYFTPNSVFVLTVLDSDGSALKDNCVKTNKHRPILSAAKMYRSITLVSGNINHLQIFEGVCCGSVVKPELAR